MPTVKITRLGAVLFKTQGTASYINGWLHEIALNWLEYFFEGRSPIDKEYRRASRSLQAARGNTGRLRAWFDENTPYEVTLKSEPSPWSMKE